ncbi:MAG: AAA family ATPase [Planctomycetaceae bacterium]
MSCGLNRTAVSITSRYAANRSTSEITDILSNYQPRDLTLVVLDAKYRFFADGMEENSNDDQTKFHNAVDWLARQLDCVIMLVHHSTKGNQTGKGVTDVGSGGGSQSRAVDCHLVIRPHENEGLAVLDAAVRTFAPVESQTISWEFPLWSVAHDVEPILKQDKSRGDSRQEAKDKQAIAKLTEIFSKYDWPLTRSVLRKETGFNADKLNRLLRIGIDDGVFQSAGEKTAHNGAQADLFSLVEADQGGTVRERYAKGTRRVRTVRSGVPFTNRTNGTDGPIKGPYRTVRIVRDLKGTVWRTVPRGRNANAPEPEGGQDRSRRYSGDGCESVTVVRPLTSDDLAFTSNSGTMTPCRTGR